MPLSAPMAAALLQPAVMLTHCLMWDLPDGPLCLTEALFYTFTVDGEATFFDEKDATYGVLGAIGPINDGVMDEAPTTSFVIFPPDNAAMAALAAPEVQGSRVRIWAVTLDPVTGTVLGTPEGWFNGESDVLTNTVDAGLRSLTITVNSALARPLQPAEGAKMNNGFHQKCRPGELGFQYISSVARNIPWGSDTPTSSLSAAQAAAYSRLYNPAYFGV